MWVFSVILVKTYLLYETAHIIIRCKKKGEILSQYEFRIEIALSCIQKKKANVAENGNNNNRERDDVTRSSVESSIVTRGGEKN